MKKEKKRFVLKKNVELAIVAIIVVLTIVALTCFMCYVIAGSCNNLLAFGCLVICYMLSIVLDKYGREN